jgi:CubicO group peptidase (beta-lactamase class C family)
MLRGGVVYEQAYGTRDAPGVDEENDRPVLLSTPFRIGSVSKSVTALTTLRLAQDGLLDLDDVVFGEGGVLNSMLDDHDNVDPLISNITIGQLQRHWAGFATELTENDPRSDPMFSSRYISSQLGIAGPATCVDTITFMLDIPLAFAPGPPAYAATVYNTDTVYSNFGYCVLGHVIEKVTSLSYEEAVRKWLLDPAGVDPDEMYLGKTRLEDIPPEEAQYAQQGDASCFGPSVYPEDGNVTCPYGASFVYESAQATSGWVASSRQLLKIVAAVFPPHCKLLVDGRLGGDCLLGESWLQLFVEKTTYPWGFSWWDGLGLYLTEDEAGNLNTWALRGDNPGTAALVTVHLHDTGRYAYAAVFNGNNVTGIVDNDFSTAFDDMAKCVDEWPSASSSTSGSSKTMILMPVVFTLVTFIFV